MYSRCKDPELYSDGIDIVALEQITVVGHRLEFKIIIGRVLEKHGHLLARLAGEAKGRGDDKFDIVRNQPLGQ